MKSLSHVVLIIASVTGDVTSITALSAALPTMLLEAQFLRVLEVEADQFALQSLQDHDIPPKHFADSLVRMENASRAYVQMPNYLATHTATHQRVKLFQDQVLTNSGE